MKVAYSVDTHGGPYSQPIPTPAAAASFTEQLLDEAALAERVGWDGLAIPERHARTETMFPQAMLLATALATVTNRVKIMTWVVQPSYYNPSHLAEMVAAVDVASRGRFIFGVGPGFNPAFFNHLGEPFDQRLGRFLESVAFMRRAWTEHEPFDWDGKYWQMKDVVVTPKPYQRPMPPLWYSATTEKPLMRAARAADGIAINRGIDDLALVRDRIDRYRAAAIRAGRPPVVSIHSDGFCAPTADEAATLFGEAWIQEIRYYMNLGFYPPTPEIPDAGHATFARLQRHLIIGDPEQCRQRLAAFQAELGLTDDDWLILRLRTPNGPGRDAVARGIALMGTEVLPAVR